MKKETEGVQSDWTWKKGTLGFYYAPDGISLACILCRTCWGQPRNTIFNDKKRENIPEITNLHGGLTFYPDLTEGCSQL